MDAACACAGLEEQETVRRIAQGELDARRRLAFDLYDGQGHRILNAGEIPAQHPSWTALLVRGVYCHPESIWVNTPVTSRQCVLHAILLCDRLPSYFGSGEFERRVLAIVDWLELAWSRSEDVPMVDVMLNRSGPLPARHAVHTACVLKRLLRCLGGNEAGDRPALAAALSLHLTAMFDATVSKVDSAREFAALRARHHQADLAAFLRRQGVTDACWINAAQQARQLLALAGVPPMSPPAPSQRADVAQLLAMADLFCTRSADETLRLPDGSRSVLRDILIEHGAHFDIRLASLFIRALGVYPVGTVALLSNGEIGVVCDLSEQVDAPWVCSLIAPLGAPLPEPLLRDTREPLFAICESLGPTELLNAIDLEAIWGEEAADYPLPAAQLLHVS
jgi:hypothetical protein